MVRCYAAVARLIFCWKSSKDRLDTVFCEIHFCVVKLRMKHHLLFTLLTKSYFLRLIPRPPRSVLTLVYDYFYTRDGRRRKGGTTRNLVEYGQTSLSQVMENIEKVLEKVI